MGSIGESHAPETFDVIVVGGGNAALCAALSAQENGARTLIIECASKEDRGGNSRFAGTIFRAPHSGLDQIKTILCPGAMEDAKLVTVGPYTAEKYAQDLSNVTHGKNDPAISKVLIQDCWSIMEWMRDKGVEWILALRKYYNVDGLKEKKDLIDMEPGHAIMTQGAGQGLVNYLWTAVEKTANTDNPITIRYECPAHDLIMSGDTCLGVRTRQGDHYNDIYGKVVLASGGFSANPAMRRQYLGEGWDLVLVRGSKYNMGTMLRRAVDAGARPVGHWGAAHASPQDFHGPLSGDINISPHIPRYAYQYGISVNINGQRFFDEGEDNWGRTYAKTGKKIADQPEAKAFQIFDQQTVRLLPKRYETATPIKADTLEELARAMGVNSTGLMRTVEEFNAACPDDSKFDPNVNDGLCTARTLAIPKSNWALKVDKPPFQAYAVTCGITFTYGGISTDTSARVLNNEGKQMPGLWGIGEIAGGLFYHNYPGGAGLTKGAVFGRIAGREAALASRKGRGHVNGTNGSV